MDLPGVEEQKKGPTGAALRTSRLLPPPPNYVPVKWLGREEAVGIWPPFPTKLDLGPPRGES